MANLGPAYVVDGPIPAAPAFTLVGAAQIGEEADAHWVNGIAMRRYPCGPADAWDPCSTGTTRPKTVPSNIAPLGDYNPFVVVMAISCTTRQGLRDHPDRVRAAFQAGEHWRVEREFWNGDIVPTNPHLAQASAAIQASGVGPITALSYLEEAIADSAQAGYVHAPTFVVNQWSRFNLVSDAGGGRLKTKLGTIVVPGSGYAFTGPTGVDPNGTGAIGQAWAYATGPVKVWRSEIFMVPDDESQAIDRVQNTITYRAERSYAVLWDRCLHAAVNMTLTSSL